MRSSWLLVGVSPFVLAAACSSDDGGSGTGGSAGVGGGFGGVGAQGGAAGSAGSFGGSAGSLGGSAGQAGDAAAGSAGQDGSAASGGAGGVGGVGGTGGSGAIDGGPPPVVTPGAADRILLKGTVITPSGPIAGEVLVEQTNITCVAASCSAQAGASGATVIETNGVILPGMIDAHNHGLFNIFDESDWTPTKLYMNHNQWTSPSNEPRYTQTVDAKQYLEAVSNGANVSCEMDKYAETKAIIGATTSFLLAGSQQRSCYASVARTIDTTYNDLPADKVQVSSLGVPDNTGAKDICENFADGTTDAYVVHVAEGIDGTSKNEFTALQARGVVNDPVGPPGCLMNAKTTIVHGTALGAPEFTIMAQNDMGLVWSPKSNVFLYGATTNIPAAIAAGLDKIALAPDWALGGSVNLLDELAFAANFDDTTWGDALSSQRLVEMVTIDAARALGVQQYIGSLEVNKRADIAVVSDIAADAYDSVIQARPSTVRLVMVDGRIVYGDQAIEPAAPTAPGCENLDVCGAPKIVCIAETSTANKLNQTLAQIKTVLETELSAYDASEQPAGGPFMPLAPLFKCP